MRNKRLAQILYASVVAVLLATMVTTVLAFDNISPVQRTDAGNYGCPYRTRLLRENNAMEIGDDSVQLSYSCCSNPNGCYRFGGIAECPSVWDCQSPQTHFLKYSSEPQEISRSDGEAPSITDVNISNISADGYDVSCKVTDNKELSRVEIFAWTVKNGQDDIETLQAARVGNEDVFTCRVNVSSHNNESGPYTTHIYAYDKAGNVGFTESGVCQVPEQVFSQTNLTQESLNRNQPYCEPVEEYPNYPDEPGYGCGGCCRRGCGRW